MLSPRLVRLLLLRSFRARPLRALTSILGIILGVAGMLAIAITNQAALTALEQLFSDASGSARLSIIPAGSDEQALPEILVRSVQRVPGVQAAVPLVKTITTLADEQAVDEVGLSFFGFNAGGMVLHGVDPLVEKQAREYRVTAGNFLSSDLSANEIMLVDTFAADNDLAVGQRIGLATPNGVETVQVVGLFAKEGPGLTNNGAFAIMPLQTVQRFYNQVGEVDQIDILVTESYEQSNRLESLREDLQSRLGKQFSVIYPASQGQRTTQMLSNYQIGLNFLSGISLFVGAYLIYNAFAMTVVERTREFGMLRTVGMTRTQIAMQVLVEALILGGFGSTLGVGLGILLSRGLSQLMGGLLNIDLAAMEIPPQSVVVAFLLGLMVTLMGAFVPARQAGSVSPVEAMRVRGQTKEGWLVRHGWKSGILLLIASISILLWNPFAYDPQFMLGSLTVFLLFLSITLILPAALTPFERALRPLLKAIYGVCGTLGSRNLERARVRSSITLGALLVGVAMILVVRGMTESFVVDLRVWLQAYLGGDIYINAAVPLRRTLGTQLEGVPGVAAAAPIRYFPVEWQAESEGLQTITFMAIDPAAHSRVTSFAFSEGDTDPLQAMQALAQGDHVFLASVLAEKYGLQRGDQIFLRTRGGMRPFTIAAVVVDFYNNGQMVTGSWTDMRRYFRINDANTFLVRVDDDFDEVEVEQQIDQQLGKRYQLVLELNQSLRDRAFALLDQAFFMFDVLAVIAITVASLGVVNTLTMSVFERTREIGMLRATGLTRSQVLRMILAEAAMMGLVGGVLGVLLGVTLTRIFLLGMTAMSGYSLTFTIPLEGMVISLVIALLVSQAAALLPAMRAARTRILEAIQFE